MKNTEQPLCGPRCRALFEDCFAELHERPENEKKIIYVYVPVAAGAGFEAVCVG